MAVERAGAEVGRVTRGDTEVAALEEAHLRGGEESNHDSGSLIHNLFCRHICGMFGVPEQLGCCYSCPVGQLELPTLMVAGTSLHNRALL